MKKSSSRSTQPAHPLWICVLIIGFCALPCSAEEMSDKRQEVAEIGLTLSATTDSTLATPAFNCQGDGLYKFSIEKSGLSGVGQMQNGRCTLQGPIPIHQDIRLLSLTADGSEQESVLYKINTLTGAIEGDGLLAQTTIFFDGKAMSYGMSHAAPPLTDQTYIYLGSSKERWMEALQTDMPDLQINELVLPGAHDAGMYTLNVDNLAAVIEKLCANNNILEDICKGAGNLGSDLGSQAITNLALNQKDIAYDQLRIGTRFFDLRPAYGADGVAFHVHNFVPGVKITSFLKDINRFLVEMTREVVFIQASSHGIDQSAFTPLTKTQVEQILAETIVPQVGYSVVDSIADINDQKLADVAASGARVLVIFSGHDINTSYHATAYSQSLTDPSAVIGAVEATLAKCTSSTYQYNNLNLQDTGQLALEHYEEEIAVNLASWVNDLLLSDTGSLLQATKPFFDRGTYAWLVEEPTLASIAQCKAPVMLLNDFVDPALAARAEALSRYRHTHADVPRQHSDRRVQAN